MVACGGGADGNAPTTETSGETTEVTDMKVAMITDSGDITDQSFNQTTYESCKAWAESNGVEFNYYKPESDADESRNASVDQAVADGANVIVMPGYMFAATVVAQSEMYPDVKFVALDVSAGDICEKGVGEGYDYNPANWNVTDYYNTENVYCCTYQEELSGYMAGYGAVKLGYKHLGFLGGMSVPAVTRFGYGFVQGADAAAKELGIENEVAVEYVCGGQFYGDADITAYMDTWYSEKGVEVVFACGGGIYTSAAEAAVKTGGKVIGVDSDQSFVINEFQEDLTITSAMKGLATTVNTLLTEIKAGNWSNYAGKIDNLGLVSETAEENFVQLPIETTQFGDGFTEEGKLYHFGRLYQRLRKKVIDTPIHHLLEMVLEETGYGDYVSALPAGSQRKANLDMLVETAIAYEKTSYKGLFHFVRYIDQLQKYEVDFGEADVTGENEDVVRLMTIHKSKGLEFPVVFVAGLSKQFNEMDSRDKMAIHPDMGLGLDEVQVSPRTKRKCLLRSEIADRIRRDNLGEELRVLYVALTRAKEKLILTGTVKNREKVFESYSGNITPKQALTLSQRVKAKSYLDWIAPAVMSYPEKYAFEFISASDLILAEVEQRAEKDLSKQELFQKIANADDALVKSFQESFAYEYPYAQEKNKKSKYSVSELKHASMVEKYDRMEGEVEVPDLRQEFE